MKRPTIFQRAVYRATRKIPPGSVATYGDVAKAIGFPRAARAVGRALHVNPYAPNVPCHRVVASNGDITGYAEGLRKKKTLLQREGVHVDHRNVIVDFQNKRYVFTNKKPMFQTRTRPVS